LDYCEHEDGCDDCRWPGDYNKWSVSKIEEHLKNDLSALNNPEIKKALADLKWKRHLEYILLLKRLKITGEVKKALEKEIAKLKQEMERTEPSPEIREKAIEILENDDPVQYIADSCGRMVLGAEKAFKKLICCVSVQNIHQSAGLHPKLNGESGGGKTWALLTFAHHLPAEAVLKGSMSAKAGYYHNDGNRILRILDDYQAGNEDLDTTIKQTSSEFHEPYTHRTVANNKALKLQIGSEQTWAITSVDSSQDIQVLNRQIPINVDDSEELTKIVNRRTIERYGEGEPQFPVDDIVLICREISRVLREENYINIRVPFYDRIEWFDTSNRRNTSIFMDILIGITAMNRFQREKDAEGYILATENDFYAAKELFVERDAEELVHRLTKRERQFAELLAKHKDGMTREEVAKALGLSPTRISHLASGEKGKGGLSQKLPGFCVREVTDYEYAPGVDKRAVRKTLYKLEGYNPLEGFDAIVKLRESAPSADGVRVEVRNEVSAEIDNSEREKREIDRGSADSAGSEREFFSGRTNAKESSLSLAGQKNPHSHQESIAIGSKDGRTTKRTAAHSAHTEAHDSDAHLSALSQENASLSIGPHPRRDLPTPSGKRDEPKVTATCPICGVEIGLGHGSQSFEDRTYCTSCAHPLPIIRGAVRSHITENALGPTTTEVNEKIVGLGNRPPRKELLPAMLRSLGFVEKDGKWETLQENLKDTTHVDPDADYVEPNDSDRAHPAEELKNELA
jgi:transcriptional regulator with XRE-family HTH domain